MNNIPLIDSLNIRFERIQSNYQHWWESSFVLKHIDNLIFITILATLVLSLFASSDLIGYVSLVPFFLTVVKMFVQKGERVSINSFEIFLLIYFMFVVISLSGSSLFFLSLKGFLKTCIYLAFYFSAAQYYKNNLSKIPLTIFIIALCAASQGIVGIFQNFVQVGEISTWQDVSNINPEDVMTRVYGTLQPYNPNLFGGYLIASLPCLFGGSVLLALDKKYKFSIAFLILSFITSFTLILSGCRGAYVAFLAIILSLFGFLAKFIWQSGKQFLKNIYLSFTGFILTMLIASVLFVSSLRARVLSIFAMRQDSSTSFRFNVYQSAIEMFKDNWLLGIGVGNQNFREIYGLYMKTGFDALSAYSVFLEIADESGIFALLAFIGFLIVLGFKSFKFISNTLDIKKSVFVSIAITAVAAIMVHGLVDTIFFRPQVQFLFWVMVAFISSVLRSEGIE